MADSIFDGITTDGNTKVKIVSAIANPAVPKITELNGGTTVDISCLLASDGWNLSVEEAAIADKRLCDREDYERRGRTKYSLEITYVRADDPDEDKAYTTLVPGYLGFAVIRQGEDYASAFAVGDEVTVIPIEAGKRRQIPGGENEVFKRIQKLFVRGHVNDDVLTVAGP